MRITVGATSSTLGSACSWSPRLSCITALENAKKIEELGGCTKMSAPTPSTRLPHSEITPEVRPTIIRTRITWIAMAMTLSSERSRRAAMFPQNICRSEKGPSNVSFIHGARGKRLVSFRLNQETFAREHEACRIRPHIFRFCKVFNTCVDKRVEKSALSQANYTFLSTLTRFALFLCNPSSFCPRGRATIPKCARSCAMQENVSRRLQVNFSF